MRRNRPTILQIVPRLDAGGAERSTVEITEAIVRGGGRALVLSEGGRMASELVRSGGELIPFPAASKNPLRIIRNVSAIEAIARRERVELIHARSRAPAWSALGAARRAKLPFVTTYHGIYSERGRAKRFYNSVMAKGDVVIANSNYTAEMIRRRYPTPEDRIEIIHRGVDLTAFNSAAVSPERVARLRAEWGVNSQRRIVLHPARLTRWKGQEDVIAVAARFRCRFPNCVFVLAGDAQGRDEYRNELRRQIENGGLQEYVRIVGHVDDMPAAFAAADAAIIASFEPEAFGRVAAEAQAMGCPIISTNLGAPPEMIVAGSASARTGWLVQPRDLTAYEAALSEALSLDRVLRSAMAQRARAHIAARFSILEMQRATLAVYDRLLGTRLAAQFAASISNWPRLESRDLVGVELFH